MVAADGSAVVRCRLEMSGRRCDADGSTARVGRSRRPADYRDADDQLCSNAVIEMRFNFQRRAMISSRFRRLSFVTPCIDVDVTCSITTLQLSELYDV